MSTCENCGKGEVVVKEWSPLARQHIEYCERCAPLINLELERPLKLLQFAHRIIQSRINLCPMCKGIGRYNHGCGERWTTCESCGDLQEARGELNVVIEGIKRRVPRMDKPEPCSFKLLPVEHFLGDKIGNIPLRDLILSVQQDARKLLLCLTE